MNLLEHEHMRVFLLFTEVMKLWMIRHVGHSDGLYSCTCLYSLVVAIIQTISDSLKAIAGFRNV